MESSDQFIRTIIGEYFKSEFSKLLPDIISKSIKENPAFIGQEFIPIRSAMVRYNLSRKTIYNYHNRGHVTLHSTGGKTFISVLDLERFIKTNPLPKKEWAIVK